MTSFFKVVFLMVFLLGLKTVDCNSQSFPALPKNQLVISSKTYHIPFQWLGDSTNAAWEPHAVLLLPVKLPDCPKQFYMQFDLGAPYSLFYRSALERISLTYPNAVKLPDSTAALTNYNFSIGQMPVHANEIQVKQFGNDPTDPADEVTIIGTIGADFIDGRVVVIDYPKQEIASGLAFPATVKVSELSDFMYMNRSVLLPAVINGKRTVLFFDTGASAFELLTDKATFNQLQSPAAVPVQYPVKSWDRTLTAHIVATADSLEVGLQKLPIKRVAYMEGASNTQVEQMMQLGIGGMTGNKLFLNHRLLLDTKNKKFAVLAASQKRNR